MALKGSRQGFSQQVSIEVPPTEPSNTLSSQILEMKQFPSLTKSFAPELFRVKISKIKFLRAKYFQAILDR
jgi:hypothetical protein